MAKKPRRSDQERLSDPDWGLVYKFAIGLEKGRFNEYIETLQDTKKLLWKSFLSGVAKGFGVVVGATVVVAILVALLALLAKVIPSPVDQPLIDTGKKIQDSTL